MTARLWKDGQAVGSLKLASIYADCCVYLSGLSHRGDTRGDGGREGKERSENGGDK